jgi:hypothetical protein
MSRFFEGGRVTESPIQDPRSRPNSIALLAIYEVREEQVIVLRCHRGGALRLWLVVSGGEAGNVWCDDRADYMGITPILWHDGRRRRSPLGTPSGCPPKTRVS